MDENPQSGGILIVNVFRGNDPSLSKENDPLESHSMNSKANLIPNNIQQSIAHNPVLVYIKYSPYIPLNLMRHNSAQLI